MGQRVLAEVDQEISKRNRQVQGLTQLQNFFGSNGEEGAYAENMYTVDQFFDCEIPAEEAFQDAREIIEEKIPLDTEFPLTCLFDALDIYSNLDHCRIIREETEGEETGGEELSESSFPPSLDTLDNNGDGIPHEEDELFQFAYGGEGLDENDEPGDYEAEESKDAEDNPLDKLLENRRVNPEVEEIPLDAEIEEMIRKKIEEFEEHYSDVAEILFSPLREANNLQSAKEEFKNQYKILQVMANGPINKENFEKGFQSRHSIDLDSDAVSESFRLVDPDRFTVRDYFVPIFIVLLMSLPGALDEEETKYELLQAFYPGQKVSSDSISERMEDISGMQDKDAINMKRYMAINAELTRFAQIARSREARLTMANDINEDCREDLENLIYRFMALGYINHNPNDPNKFYTFVQNGIVPQFTKMAYSKEYKKEDEEDEETIGYDGYNTEKEGLAKRIKKGIHKKFLGEEKKILATGAERFKKGAQKAKSTNQNSRKGIEGFESSQEVEKKQNHIHDVGTFEYLDRNYHEQLKVMIVKLSDIDRPMANTLISFLPQLFVYYDIGSPPPIQKYSDKKRKKSKDKKKKLQPGSTPPGVIPPGGNPPGTSMIPSDGKGNPMFTRQGDTITINNGEFTLKKNKNKGNTFNFYGNYGMGNGMPMMNPMMPMMPMMNPMMMPMMMPMMNPMMMPMMNPMMMSMMMPMMNPKIMQEYMQQIMPMYGDFSRFRDNVRPLENAQSGPLALTYDGANPLALTNENAAPLALTYDGANPRALTNENAGPLTLTYDSPKVQEVSPDEEYNVSSATWENRWKTGLRPLIRAIMLVFMRGRGGRASDKLIEMMKKCSVNIGTGDRQITSNGQNVMQSFDQIHSDAKVYAGIIRLLIEDLQKHYFNPELFSPGQDIADLEYILNLLENLANNDYVISSEEREYIVGMFNKQEYPAHDRLLTTFKDLLIDKSDNKLHILNALEQYVPV